MSEFFGQSIDKAFSFHLPTKVIFGPGSLDKLPSELSRIGGKKFFLVTDKTIRAAGLADKVQAQLGGRDFVIFDEVEPEPRIENAERISEESRRSGCDTIIGVGGGSVLDMAKIATIMISNQGKLQEYTQQVFNIDTFERRGRPLCLIPTTAGTGSEVSSTSMIIQRESKKFLISPLLYPDVAIVDPVLTLTMPKSVTAATGLDALAHCIEGLMSRDSTLLTDALAYRGIELIAKNLRTAYSSGNDLKARTAMCLAATMAGMVLQAKMVYGHSVAYTIAVRHRLPHGVSVAIPLPYIMEYNLDACVEKLAKIAELFGMGVHETKGSTLAHKAVEAVYHIIRDLNVPTSLRQVGVNRDSLNELARECLTLYPRPNSPVSMNEADASKLYERMWEGMSFS